MNSTLLTEKLNNKQDIASNVKSFWNNYFGTPTCRQIFLTEEINYPFWENKNQFQTDFCAYHGVITAIDSNFVTVNIENPYSDQSECYILERKLFDFCINIEDMVEIIVENIPGQTCIKTHKYIKNQYYSDKENCIISKIIRNINEEDDF